MQYLTMPFCRYQCRGSPSDTSKSLASACAADDTCVRQPAHKYGQILVFPCLTVKININQGEFHFQIFQEINLVDHLECPPLHSSKDNFYLIL